MIYNFTNRKYDMFSRTFLMGILNITPDSFSDGGKYFDGKVKMDRIISDALRMESEGADFIDVGGESTRPGSESITIDEELERVIPVIAELKTKVSIPLSIDTYKSAVAGEALSAGAEIVNDISGFRFDEKIAEVTARHNASCVLMHIKGTPKNMQQNPEYDDVVEEVYSYLDESVNIASELGIRQIMIDPGIGFGKNFDHNIMLLRNLKRFRDLGYPLLLGVSRKSFINKIYPSESGERLEGTIAANVLGIMNGANVLRVHEVTENSKAARVADKIIHNQSVGNYIN